MSAAGSTPAPADQMREQLRQARVQAKLIEAQMRLAALEKRQRRLTESQEAFEWLGSYQDVIDRLRSPDRDFTLPFSTAADRRHGDNWPFWRSWQEHARVRASARMLCTLSTLAGGVLTGLTSYVIGEGFKYRAVSREGQAPDKALLSAVQAAVDEFSEVNEWPAREQELFRRSRRDGEYFLRYFDGDDGCMLTRTVEPEHVVEPAAYDPQVSKYGVITSAEDLESVEGFFVSYDGSSANGEEVPADEAVHCKINVDRLIKRGLTDFSYDTYDGLKSAQRLLENMAEGGAVQASIALVRQHEGSSSAAVSDFVGGIADYEQTSGVTGRTEKVERFYPGKIVDIPKGLNYVAPPFSANAQGFVAVVQATLRAVGVRWNAPEWLTSGDASNNNYASSVTAEAPFVKTCKRRQAFYASHFLRTVRAAVKRKCDAGMLRVQGRVLTWREVNALACITAEPPKIESRDLSAQAQQDQIYVGMGAKSPQIVAQELGHDYDQVVKDLEAHQQQAPGGLGLGGEGGGMGGQEDPLAAMLGGGGFNEQHALTADEYAEALMEASKHKVGDTWQGPSGRWFTVRKDGRVVPGKAPGGKPAPAKAKATKGDPAAVLARIKDLQGGGASAEDLTALTEDLRGLTVEQLNGVKKQLGLKASGPKAELAGKIAERALAGVKAAKAEPAAVPAPEAPSAPAPAPKKKAPAPKPAAKLTPHASVEDAVKGLKFAYGNAANPRTPAEPIVQAVLKLQGMPRADLDKAVKDAFGMDSKPSESAKSIIRRVARKVADREGAFARAADGEKGYLRDGAKATDLLRDILVSDKTAAAPATPPVVSGDGPSSFGGPSTAPPMSTAPQADKVRELHAAATSPDYTKATFDAALAKAVAEVPASELAGVFGEYFSRAPSKSETGPKQRQMIADRIAGRRGSFLRARDGKIDDTDWEARSYKARVAAGELAAGQVRDDIRRRLGEPGNFGAGDGDAIAAAEKIGAVSKAEADAYRAKLPPKGRGVQTLPMEMKDRLRDKLADTMAAKVLEK